MSVQLSVSGSSGIRCCGRLGNICGLCTVNPSLGGRKNGNDDYASHPTWAPKELGDPARAHGGNPTFGHISALRSDPFPLGSLNSGGQCPLPPVGPAVRVAVRRRRIRRALGCPRSLDHNRCVAGCKRVEECAPRRNTYSDDARIG
jgi:hypothetical protein